MQHLASLLLVGAMGVAAHPSGHGHGRLHNRNIGDLITATINGAKVTWTQTQDYGAVATTPAAMIKSGNVAAAKAAVADVVSSVTSAASSIVPTATPTSSAAAAAKTAASSSSSSSGSGTGVTTYTTFEKYCATAAKKNKRATLAQIAYAGNVGSVYGCNIMPVATEAIAAKYDNTVKFYGAPEDQICVVWNKIGSDGGINGFFGLDATEFKLAAGATQYVAIDANSQGGAACFPGTSSSDVWKTSIGEIAGTWLEFDFENTSNGGYSGADASCIVAETYNLTVPGLSVCTEDGSQCSTISSGGAEVKNAYNAKLVDADGIGCIVPGPMKVAVDLGF